MKFWYINKSYIDFLRENVTDKIMHWDSPNYNHPKYCLGVVFKINGLNYFAPISSIKEKQLSDQDGLFLNDYFEKLSFPIQVEHLHHGRIVASIKFNYMFPIHHADCCYVNTGKFSEYGFENSYKIFVDKQYSYCLKHRDSIRKMASEVYNKAVNRIDNFHNHCLDFLLIEQAYQEWIKNHQTSSVKIFPVANTKRL